MNFVVESRVAFQSPFVKRFNYIDSPVNSGLLLVPPRLTTLYQIHVHVTDTAITEWWETVPHLYTGSCRGRPCFLQVKAAAWFSLVLESTKLEDITTSLKKQQQEVAVL